MANRTEALQFTPEGPGELPNVFSEKTKLLFQRGMSVPLSTEGKFYCLVHFLAEDAVVIEVDGQQKIIPSTDSGQKQEIDVGAKLRVSFYYPFLRLVPKPDPGKVQTFGFSPMFPIDSQKINALNAVVDASGHRSSRTEAAPQRSNPTLVAESPRQFETVFEQFEFCRGTHDLGRETALAIADENGNIFWRAVLRGQQIIMQAAGQEEKTRPIEKGGGRLIDAPDGKTGAILLFEGGEGDQVQFSIQALKGRLFIGDPEQVADEALRSIPEIGPSAINRPSPFLRGGAGFRFAMDTQGPGARRRILGVIPVTGVEEADSGREMIRLEIVDGTVRLFEPARPGAGSSQVTPGTEKDYPFVWLAVNDDGGRLSLSLATKPGSLVQIDDSWGVEGLSSFEDSSLEEEQTFHQGTKAHAQQARAGVPHVDRIVSTSASPEERASGLELAGILGRGRRWLIEAFPTLFGPFGPIPLEKDEN